MFPTGREIPIDRSAASVSKSVSKRIIDSTSDLKGRVNSSLQRNQMEQSSTSRKDEDSSSTDTGYRNKYSSSTIARNLNSLPRQMRHKMSTSNRFDSGRGPMIFSDDSVLIPSKDQTYMPSTKTVSRMCLVAVISFRFPYIQGRESADEFSCSTSPQYSN